MSDDPTVVETAEGGDLPRYPRASRKVAEHYGKRTVQLTISFPRKQG